MNAIALGPLLLSLPRLFALGAALLLLLTSHYCLPLNARQKSRWFSGLILCWLVGARVGYVLLNMGSFADTPFEALKLWQPGYHPLGGLMVGLLWCAWSLRKNLKALGIAVILLILSSALWLVAVMVSVDEQRFAVSALPEVTLENLDGEPVYLPDLAARGDRLIVNLWATWCPPCRREMPLLEQADGLEGVSVVIVNQGEDLLPVVRYLDDQALSFEVALRDPSQTLMARFDAPGLPTTVLFDADGRTQEVHVGELTRSQLERWLDN
ncbi:MULTISPECIES: prolipoprotein diacylglyceryl transferase family protein [unclassified Halomonas]|uniref:prolipoprotein diacylglyceryl transferase family protein n=1 Tax=unclassified Halomonas TaxID=2609666 RepID=UPI0020769449|nr:MULTISPECIES: prolipoprotein diacylglyceryl transferase family protein [unclassified Halomonas]